MDCCLKLNIGIVSIAAFVLKRRFLFYKGTSKVCDTMTQSRIYEIQIYETRREEKVCDTVSQSKEGERMVFTIKAVGRKYILPPIRAEPVMGEKQPIAQRKSYKNKKERINQIGKGVPSVDTGGFLFVQDKEFIHFWFWFQDNLWHFLHQQSES